MSKKKELFNDRIRFNWGYHDSRVEHADNRARVLEYTNKSDIKHVSIKRDAAYFHGYRLGRRHHWDNVPHTTSDQAWTEYKAGL